MCFGDLGLWIHWLAWFQGEDGRALEPSSFVKHPSGLVLGKRRSFAARLFACI